MPARTHNSRRLMAFFNAVAEPFAVWAWTLKVARKAVGSGPTFCTRSMVATLAPMPAAAQGGKAVLEAAQSPAFQAEASERAASDHAAERFAPAIELEMIATAPDVAPPDAVEATIALEPIVEAPVAEVLAVVDMVPDDRTPVVEEPLVGSVEPSAEIDASQAMELAEAILAAEAVNQASPHDAVACETIEAEYLATEIDRADIVDAVEPSRRSNFGLAARMAVVGTMNTPASRASKRARQVAPAGRSVPVQNPVTLKVRKSDKPATALMNRARKVPSSAEVIDLAGIREVANGKTAQRAA